MVMTAIDHIFTSANSWKRYNDYAATKTILYQFSAPASRARRWAANTDTDELP